MEFKHYLITRFNVKIGNWNSINEKRGISNDVWMTNRISLFKNYCLPSVINQISKNFTWLICLDINTNEVHKKEIEKITKQYKFINLVYVEVFNNEELCESIKKNTPKDVEYIVTTRLDNDDSLHENFIFSIQKKIELRHGIVISCIKGFCLKINGKHLLTKFNYVNNPFLTLVEEKNALTSVLSMDHTKIIENKNELKIIKNQRLWLQIIHEHNLLNKIAGIPYFNKRIFQKFNISKENYNINLWRTVFCLTNIIILGLIRRINIAK